MTEPSALHFTYEKPTGEALFQGDILKRTDELVKTLKTIHPRFDRDDYSHLIVLTQSCDLLRRNGKECKARYISVAAVRSLSTVLERAIAKYQYDPAERFEGLCSDKARGKLEDFTEKLLNNNNPEYFYLEPDVGCGLAAPSCAFLRLSVPLRSEEHYSELLNARVLALREGFRAKLGWLIGNMYSRVGTCDWVPEAMSQDSFSEKVRHLLDEEVQWVEDGRLKAARKIYRKEKGAGLRAALESVGKTKQDFVLDAVVTALEEAALITDSSLVRRTLESSTELKGLLK